MGVFFVQFRFMRHTYPKLFQNVLKETIEFGVVQGVIGVVIGTAAMNMFFFILKYVFNLVTGKEYILLKFDAKSCVLDIAVHDAIGAAVDPSAVQGEADAENYDIEPCQVLDIPHDDAAEQVGDQKKAQQGNARDNWRKTDLLWRRRTAIGGREGLCNSIHYLYFRVCLFYDLHGWHVGLWRVLQQYCFMIIRA